MLYTPNNKANKESSGFKYGQSSIQFPVVNQKHQTPMNKTKPKKRNIFTAKVRRETGSKQVKPMSRDQLKEVFEKYKNSINIKLEKMKNVKEERKIEEGSSTQAPARGLDEIKEESKAKKKKKREVNKPPTELGSKTKVHQKHLHNSYSSKVMKPTKPVKVQSDKRAKSRKDGPASDTKSMSLDHGKPKDGISDLKVSSENPVPKPQKRDLMNHQGD